MQQVDVYWSHQSPYCYFALDRILKLSGYASVQINLKLVLPGILRNRERFSGVSELEEKYFDIDVKRTAEYLSIPFSQPSVMPVQCEPGTQFRAAAEQPRVYDLYYLNQSAIELGRGLDFLDVVCRLIWDGRTENWYQTEKMKSALHSVKLDFDVLNQIAKSKSQQFDEIFINNDLELRQAGHWGVPVFVYNHEPFYGQDRFDQLIWRLDLKHDFY